MQNNQTKKMTQSLEQILQEIGYSTEQASYLASHEGFHHKRKTREELDDLFLGISETYKCDLDQIKEAVLKSPQFAGYDHERVVREANEVYNNEDKVKEAILKHPRFAGYDHKRVVREANEVYQNEDKVKEAILKWPQFAGLDHERVVRQKSRLGRLVGLNKQEVIDKILTKPSLAGYSARRYIAGLDIGNMLAEEGFEPDEQMLKAFFNHNSRSPYVPNTRRLRISKVENGEEPPLLVYMRKSLMRARK